MPDLIALSRSLYVLSQNKNDPNTNPEIISRSRKDIFVDISWVTAKKTFFIFCPFILSKFCYERSQNCSGVIRNDQNMTQQPSPAVGGGRCPMQPPLPPHLGTVTSIPWYINGFLQEKGKTAVCIFSKKQKKTTLKPASWFTYTIVI